jgi:glycosyltransferase involved in cell wall biosynthesis
VKVVRVNDDPGFCAARARNIGAEHATAQWLCFIDADICVSPGFLQWLADNIKPDNYYRASPSADGERNQETWGTFVCQQEVFEKVGGYDEAFRGWGGEDDELYNRLALEKYTESEYPSDYIQAIQHDDEMRTLFYGIKKKEHHWFINQFYTTAKFDIARIRNKPLTLQSRHALMNDIQTALAGWFREGAAKPFSFTVAFELSAWLPVTQRMTRKYHLTYETPGFPEAPDTR